MKTLTVNLGDRSYPIHIGPDLLGKAELITPHIRGKQVLVVTNDTVAPLYLEKVMQSLDAYNSSSLILPDGEQYKTLNTVNDIFTRLLENRFNRDATLIALGGGVIGDITGFAAASYQRGVDFIQIPTTLLAQVDSSVGGKTGVNHPLGKNMIGAFHQPNVVIADTSTLNTLEDRQLAAGIAEVIKYGLIRDSEFFKWLQENMDQLLSRQPDALIYAIEKSCQCKADIVADDEKEQGVRALLNLGHTFGHAIEAGTGYGNWLHGEGVATGMAMAADLSKRLGWITSSDVDIINVLLTKANLPVKSPAEISNDRFQELMSIDKKVMAGTLRLILLKSIGKAVITDQFKTEQLLETLNHCRAT